MKTPQHTVPPSGRWARLRRSGFVLSAALALVLGMVSVQNAAADVPTSVLLVSPKVTSDAVNVTYAPFEVTVTCRLGGVGLEGGDFVNGRFVFPVSRDQLVQIVVPVGAQCYVDETKQGGANPVSIVYNGKGSSKFTDGPEAILEDGDPITILDADSNVAVITNNFDAGVLSVKKSVAGDGASAYGSGPFAVQVSCYFQDSLLTEGEISLVGGEVKPFSGKLPAGTVCSVSETANGGATSTTVQLGNENIESVTIGASDVLVDITNYFNVGYVAITKEVTGEGATTYGAGPFTAQVTCTYDVDDEATVVALPNSGEVILNAANNYSAMVSDGDGPFGIPAGSDCTVTEPKSGGATQIMTGDSVSVVGNETVDLNLKNVFDVGSMEIIKERKGDGVDIFGAGPFTVTVNCTYLVDGVLTGFTREAVLNNGNGYEATIDDVILGARCVVEESDDGGATSSEIYSDGEVFPVEGVEIVPDTFIEKGSGDLISLVRVPGTSVTVVNTFDAADLVIVKKRDGDGAPQFGAGPFTVGVSCLYNGNTYSLGAAGSQVLSQGNGYVATITGLPVGAACTVVEPDNGGAVSTVITPNNKDATRGAVVISSAGSTVQVVNTFKIGRLQISKVVDKNQVAPGGAAAYTVTVTNIGAVDFVDGQADDTLPTGAVLVSATGSPVVTGMKLNWTIASLPIGKSVSFTVLATFPNSGSYTNSFGVEAK
ncbi:DUF11 domain-containing protein [Nakamurella antarctica]|uniref:DUF11 domain-containing protein n=1 Tax=Nakamurella antarctica TaxID=1902245 RepID=A0A3G8ZIJ9_9ACTN|nr:DUF5979 domain-containing protein [Nakamurella antarctica]AZI57222.1 DUF11 domain-containing protein [Nakamurella antarctica]